MLIGQFACFFLLLFFAQSSAYIGGESSSVVKVLMPFIRLGTWGSNAIHRVTCNVVRNVFYSKNNKINEKPGGNMTLMGQTGAGVQHSVYFF